MPPNTTSNQPYYPNQLTNDAREPEFTLYFFVPFLVLFELFLGPTDPDTLCRLTLVCKDHMQEIFFGAHTKCGDWQSDRK